VTTAALDPIDRITRLPGDFPAPRAWWICFGFALALLLLFFVSVGVLLTFGVGVWGNNIPVNWGLAIVNYVWFLGIGHAGTLISALLLLTGTGRRNALNRFAEAMTLFSVVCAGLYPILHLGRPWLFYWMAPYPNTMTIWPQFKSPLAWDFFAVLIYLTGSVLFWYLGAIPDFAAMRDRSRSTAARFAFGVAALGWRGEARHWARWQQAYWLVAAIAVPLVFGVTASYALLFAAGPIPGWASGIFPAYFFAGAVFSGFAVVAIIAVTLRHGLKLGALVTESHLNLIGQLLLATGLMTAYGYFADAFTVLWSGDAHELNTLHDRWSGTYAWSYWGAVLLNFLPLQLLWFRRVRVSPVALVLIGACVTVGMWFERFMLLVTGLYRDWLVSSWGFYAPSFWEWALFAGMIGVFLAPFLLFVRFLPVMSVFELREAQYEASHG
jgi:Ni/Fe-hydrogenase subunit HybB-like protein